MKKRYPFYILLLISFIIILIMGCQKKEAKSNTDTKDTNAPPAALEDLQKLSEDVLATVSKKDWSGGVDQIKSLHSKWNDFFADAQKKGLSTDKIDAFNKDLNILTNLVISKAMEESKKQTDLEYKKTAIELEQATSKEESSNQGSSGGQQSNSKKGGQSSSQESLKLPEEVLPDAYPLMTSTASELEIAHAAVNLTKHIPYMTELFKSKLPSEVLLLKYQLRDIKISSKQNKWDIVNGDMKEIDELWPRFQPKVIEKKDTLAIQFNQSLVELKEVIKQKDSTLTTIKSDIALENIKKMSDEFE